jgi:hypothetical protein
LLHHPASPDYNSTGATVIEASEIEARIRIAIAQLQAA